ncbi:MAG: right-handed parallel beta-helix repeat-containing protein [Planctomycetes bacterium]|nr:right-handed parallel beta-helix repeat-containing protein [Planctomycetota bacterium]MCG2684997.1 right-handed parallel beta-helix repeat-containing protein [Planctomycetales bacterium]
MIKSVTELRAVVGFAGRWAVLLVVACAQSNLLGADLGDSRHTPRNPPDDLSTMRPFRVPHRMTLTVGQDEGDLQGKDDKIIQAAVDYVFRLGGGAVRVLPGTYTMRNAVFLRPGVTLRGAGLDTVLKKTPCVSSRGIRDADWYEYGIQVADPKGFVPGCGIAVSNDKPDWPPVRLFTVTAVRENVLYVDRLIEKNFWIPDNAKVQTLFSLICGNDVDDVRIEDIVLDGNRAENENLDGNHGGAAFLQYGNRWTFRNVVAQNFNGDGFSFQVCDDVHFENCRSINNASRGFHPGSGSQRPVFKKCVAKGNSQGLFWCWGVCDGLAEDCTFSENTLYGTSFGHRDTDNVLRRCTIERNGKAGVLFRKEDRECLSGDRNRIEECLIRDNGCADGCGVDIRGETRDIAIVRCRFENSPKGKQKIAVRIGPEAERIALEGNAFTGCPVEVSDLREKQAAAKDVHP